MENQLNQVNLQVEQFACKYVPAYILEIANMSMIVKTGKISTKCDVESKANIEI
jgi:hypothetical protein